MNEGKDCCFRKERTSRFPMAAKSQSLMDVHRLQTCLNSPSTFLESSDSFKKTFRAPLGNVKAPLVFPLKWNESLVSLHFKDSLLTCNNITNITVKMEARLGNGIGYDSDYSYLYDFEPQTWSAALELLWFLWCLWLDRWGRLSGPPEAGTHSWFAKCDLMISNSIFRTLTSRPGVRSHLLTATKLQTGNCLQMYKNIL